MNNIITEIVLKTPDGEQVYLLGREGGSISIEVDKSLTIEGAAADAKTVGDKLAKKVSFTDYPVNKLGNRKAGVIAIDNYYGMGVGSAGSEGVLIPYFATTNEINTKYSNRFISSHNFDYALVKGLTTNTNVLTDEEKESVQKWLGLEKEYDHKIIFEFIGLDEEADLILGGSNGRITITVPTKTAFTTYEELKQYLKVGQKIDWGWFEEGSWVEQINAFWEITEINDSSFTVTDNSDTILTVTMTNMFDIVAEAGMGSASVEIDKTLTIDGAGADAKVVGEKFAKKLDKKTNTSSAALPQAYLVDRNNNTILLEVTEWGASPNTIPKRDHKGAIAVATPTGNNDAVNKKYADDLFANASGKLYKHNISFYGYIEPGGGDLAGNFNITFQKLSTRKEAYEGITADIFNGVDFLYITDWTTAEFEGASQYALYFYYLPLRIEYIEYDMEDENGNKYTGVDVVPLTGYGPSATLYTNQEFKNFLDTVYELEGE